jgi:hypothetical protein
MLSSNTNCLLFLNKEGTHNLSRTMIISLHLNSKRSGQAIQEDHIEWPLTLHTGQNVGKGCMLRVEVSGVNTICLNLKVSLS